MSLPRLFPGSLRDAIFHCRRRDGVAEAARNAMKQSKANKVATNPHGKGEAARNECGAERANSTRFFTAAGMESPKRRAMQ